MIVCEPKVAVLASKNLPATYKTPRATKFHTTATTSLLATAYYPCSDPDELCYRLSVQEMRLLWSLPIKLAGKWHITLLDSLMYIESCLCMHAVVNDWWEIFAAAPGDENIPSLDGTS